MPPVQPRPVLWAGRLFIALLAGAGIWMLWAHPIAAGSVMAGVWVACAFQSHREGVRLNRLALDRKGESICHFAKSIDCRRLDTWVVRAVFEEVQAAMGHHGAVLPIRATDRLREDLHFDADDLDLSLVPDIAQRAGRDLSSTQGNPFYGKVTTVGDLVHFLNAQPRLQVAVA